VGLTVDEEGRGSSLDNRQGISATLTLVLAIVCGLAVANIYYSQPILDVLARALHTDQSTVTLIVTLTQIGYAVGLLTVPPLGDMLENRTLTAGAVVVSAVVLIAAGASPNFGLFLAASAILGLTSVVAHVLIPFAAHLAPERSRGSVVGRIGSGIILGILLARTMSSLITDAFGWRAVFFISAGLMGLSALMLRLMLPMRRPAPIRYSAVMVSLVDLVRTYPVLRLRAGCQSLLFAGFSAYWTAVAYELIDHHGFTQSAVGLFALVGATGAIVLPIAGRLTDSGRGRMLFPAALVITTAAMVVAGLGEHHVALLGAAAILLDIGMSCHQICSQHQLYQMQPDARARLNGIFMGSVFTGGAVGSALAGPLYGRFGWTGVTIAAGAFAAVALIWTLFSRAGRTSP
jgi:predicted MFS family arabinose efflux permease